MALRARRILAFALLLAAIAPVTAASPASALTAPVAAGTSACNISLKTAGRQVVTRWVARETGTLNALHMRIQADGSDCRQNGKTGYGAGNGGSWYVTTHPVLEDGRPDMTRTLVSQEFRPCDAPLSTVDVRQGIVRLQMNLPVVRGGEYATVIRNSDPEPTKNYTSTNFLYTSTGIAGANGRNERSALATDAHYGLDPRELVGYSGDGGRTWEMPTGSYPGQQNFLPTYLQEFASGNVTGQQFYYAMYPSNADRTMTFRNIRRTWAIRELGAFAAQPGKGTLTLTVDGAERARVAVTGPGMMRAAIPATTVEPGQTVKVTSRGLPIANIVADTAWGRLSGMNLTTSPFKVDNEPNFTHAAPVYALPAPSAVADTTTRTARSKRAARRAKSKRRRAARTRRSSSRA